jgi:SAM-dependent methyltransferase
MQAQPDYFSNHERARKFPWSLYHRPLEDSLAGFLRDVAARNARPDVLVVGCGLLHEADQMPANLRLHLVDIDPRAIEAVLARKDPRIVGGTVVSPDGPLELSQRFDAIYGKEVIEHVSNPGSYLRQLRAVLRENGRLWLSTPNYGEPWLPLLESTFLEAVARASGYTRRGMHPSKFSRRTFARALADAGFSDVQVRTVSRRLALVGEATER